MARRLESLVEDIADDVSVDWDAAGASRSGPLLREFRIIAAIGSARRGATDGWSGRLPHIVDWLLEMAAVIAVARFIVAGAAALTAVPFRAGPIALMAVVFCGSGLWLRTGGRGDQKARSLGTVFLLIGSSWAQPYLTRAGSGVLASVAVLLQTIPADAFLPLSLWVFGWHFPATPRTRHARRFGWWGAVLTAVVGVFLFTVNALSDGTAGPVGPLDRVLRVFDRRSGLSAYWPIVMLGSSLALPFLVWKTRSGSVDERKRLTWFALALTAATLPAMVVVIASVFVPALTAPPLQGVVGLSFGLALISIIPTTAYAVLVEHLMDVHVVLRRTLQHALARKLVWALCIVPLVYAGVSLYFHRHQTISELAGDHAGILLISVAGFAALTFRHRLLQGVDAWFRRDDVDYSESLGRLVDGLEGQRHARELQQTLTDELGKTLRTTMTTVLVLNDEQSAFVSLDGRADALPASSTLASLLAAGPRELDLTAAPPGDTLSMLPHAERVWVTRSGTRWLFPLSASSGELLGVLSLGSNVDDLPYSERDRAFTSAAVSQVALRMENLSLRQWVVGSTADTGAVTPAHLMDWANEPGTECPTCLTVDVADAVACRCGAAMTPAPIPAVLNGKFRIERKLGKGGMGVVYSALDIVLGRRVAIKTMPSVTPGDVARLQREARAMASVGHPNLAMIYGVERWRDSPLLVVEYLGGGTLADSLRDRPLNVDEVIELGIVLADVLDRMHTAGILHRDIKPSNIGYSADGVVKLLDFGLAAMLDTVRVSDAAGASQRPEASTLAALLEGHAADVTVTVSHHILGTPLYLSPEGIAGLEPQESFDLWSLAVVLYEALCARHPLAGYPVVEALRRVRSVRLPDVRDFRPDCPAPLAAFLNDALALAAERRPATAAEFRVQLQTLRQSFAPTAAATRRPLY
jgi:uncharacterized Tic20 family protein